MKTSLLLVKGLKMLNWDQFSRFLRQAKDTEDLFYHIPKLNKSAVCKRIHKDIRMRLYIFWK